MQPKQRKRGLYVADPLPVLSMGHSSGWTSPFPNISNYSRGKILDTRSVQPPICPKRVLDPSPTKVITEEAKNFLTCCWIGNSSPTQGLSWTVFLLLCHMLRYRGNQVGCQVRQMLTVQPQVFPKQQNAIFYINALNHYCCFVFYHCYLISCYSSFMVCITSTLCADFKRWKENAKRCWEDWGN